MIPIENGNYYHIYNRGTNSQTIFKDNNDNNYFLKLVSIYVDCIAEIFAYALISNHFHLMVRVKEGKEIGYLNPKKTKSKDIQEKWETIICEEEEKELLGLATKPNPEKMFQHLFSTYALYFNEKYSRTGALLEHPFQRKIIDHEKYLKQLVLYIHTNPIKHEICDQPEDYKWTSYKSIISTKPSKLSRESVIEWFDDIANFKIAHKEYRGYDDMDDYLFD